MEFRREDLKENIKNYRENFPLSICEMTVINNKSKWLTENKPNHLSTKIQADDSTAETSE